MEFKLPSSRSMTKGKVMLSNRLSLGLSTQAHAWYKQSTCNYDTQCLFVQLLFSDKPFSIDFLHRFANVSYLFE